MLCFRKIPVAKKFMDKRGGSITIFCRKMFVSQCRNFRRRESFSVSIISGIEKVWIGGGRYQDFPSNFFISQCRNFRRGGIL